jgi:tetratricopeptide (TPR) repeat protein
MLALASLQASAQTSDAAAVLGKAQAAYFSANADELRRLAADTAAWSKAAGNSELYAHGYVQFRLLQLAIADKRKREAQQAGEACTDALSIAIARDPRFVEGYALQSACYGYLAGLGGFAAIGNGSRSGKAIEAALTRDAKNPRVILINGFGLYFRPKFVGGDKDKACALFRAAASTFDASRPATGVSWGGAESHLWAGRCAADAGDVAGAQREFSRAAAIAPDFLAAKRRLTH